MFKRISIGILAVVVLALGVTGVVLAQGPTPPAEGIPPFDGARPGEGFGMRGMRGSRGMRGRQPQALANALGLTVEEVHGALAGTVAELAESQGMTLEDVVDALSAPMIERFQQAVENGHITQEQADERIAQMEERLLEGLESGSWFSMGGNGFRGHIGGAQPQALAEALGVTVEELQEALAEGQTVADIAEAQGVALEDVVDALIAPAIERFQQAVEDGHMTQEQADERIEQMEEHILQMLESGSGFGVGVGRGGFRGRPGGKRGGRWGDDTGTPCFPAQVTLPADL